MGHAQTCRFSRLLICNNWLRHYEGFVQLPIPDVGCELVQPERSCNAAEFLWSNQSRRMDAESAYSIEGEP